MDVQLVRAALVSGGLILLLLLIAIASPRSYPVADSAPRNASAPPPVEREELP